MSPTQETARPTILLIIAAASILASARIVQGQNHGASQPAPPDYGNGSATETPADYHDQPPVFYDDEPPLDYRERVWSYRTRLWRPQRFARRDSRRRFGNSPPYRGYRGPGGFRYGYGSYGYYGGLAAQTDAYLQGRHDERRFQQWNEQHDRGLKLYTGAMSDGIARFRHAEYDQALRYFLMACRQNQGDPAARLHAMYAMVALGKYDDAVLMMRRAVQLQTRLLDLPLDIRDEYGPRVDFEAHLTRLRRHVTKTANDAGLWMLLGFYQHFSGDASGADQSMRRASELAPADPLIEVLARTTRLLAPPIQTP